MRGFVITSDGKQYIGLMPIEYGWWLCTTFDKRGQKIHLVEEDDWHDTWPKRGIPIEISEETS